VQHWRNTSAHPVLRQSDELRLFLQAEVSSSLESQDPFGFKDWLFLFGN
jgi:hypothetical protein